MEAPRTPFARHALVVLGLFAGGVVVGACDEGEPDRPPDASVAPPPDADSYLAAIRSALPDETAPGDTTPDGTAPDDSAPEETPVLFLLAIEEPLGIETQAAVIDGLDDTHDVRFVDDLAAAIDDEQPGAPPRDDGIVIGFGTVAAEPPFLVRLEQYRTQDEVVATLVTLVHDGDAWTVRDTETVPAEVLVDGP